MNSFKFVLVAIFLMGWAAPGGRSAPQGGSQTGGSQIASQSLADTSWQGTVGGATKANTQARLRISSQNGSLTGVLTYDGYEETMSITQGRNGIQLKGVSYRDSRGGRSFDLDTFTGALSPDGRQMNGRGPGGLSWFELHRADLLPKPAPQSLVSSVSGTNWQGAVIYSAKGGTPAQLRIVLQNGALMAFLTYDGFEETMQVTLDASSGIQMRGVSFKDLQRGGRSFNFDTFQGELSRDGGSMNGSGRDSRGRGERFEFHRVNGQ